MKNLLLLSGMAMATNAVAADEIRYLVSKDGLKIELHADGEFAVSAYPKAAVASVQLQSIRAYSQPTTLNEACASMPSRIKLLKNTLLSEASKTIYRDGLLKMNQIILNVHSPLWLQPGKLEREIFPLSGLDAVFQWNPYLIHARDFSFPIDPSAKSLEVESVDALVKRLMAFQSVILGQKSPLSITSVPLVCDLQAGRIKLGFTLSGEHKDGLAFSKPLISEIIEPIADLPEPNGEMPPVEPVPADETPAEDDLFNELDPVSVEEPAFEAPATALPHDVSLELKWQD